MHGYIKTHTHTDKSWQALVIFWVGSNERQTKANFKAEYLNPKVSELGDIHLITEHTLIQQRGVLSPYIAPLRMIDWIGLEWYGRITWTIRLGGWPLASDLVCRIMLSKLQLKSRSPSVCRIQLGLLWVYLCC